MTTTTVEFTMPGKPYRVLTGAEVLEGFSPNVGKPAAAMLAKAKVTGQGRATVAKFSVTPKQADQLVALLEDVAERVGKVEGRTHHHSNTRTYCLSTVGRIRAALKDMLVAAE